MLLGCRAPGCVLLGWVHGSGRGAWGVGTAAAGSHCAWNAEKIAKEAVFPAYAADDVSTRRRKCSGFGSVFCRGLLISSTTARATLDLPPLSAAGSRRPPAVPLTWRHRVSLVEGPAGLEQLAVAPPSGLTACLRLDRAKRVGHSWGCLWDGAAPEVPLAAAERGGRVPPFQCSA